MKPNPGGILTGEEIVDRETEINSLWRTIEQRSIVLSSERRVGKSSLLKKMEENPRNSWCPLHYFVEGKNHPIEFVEGLYDILLEKKFVENKFNKVMTLYNKIAGQEVGSWKIPEIKDNWKLLIRSLISEIVDADKKVLIMIDELPLMLWKFIEDPDIGPNMTMDFLDTLRSLRNEFESTKKIGFIFCGSIGINLIIQRLKTQYGYNSDPINNMKIFGISGMDKDGAALLCEKLSEDEDYIFEDKDKIFQYIISETDGLPFYIHHIFDIIFESEEKNITTELVDRCLQLLINDEDDVGRFEHYVDRIKTYYLEENVKLALTILDYLSTINEMINEEDLYNIIDSLTEPTPELFKNILDLLRSDHYLSRTIKNGTRCYKFNYRILQNWWKKNRS